MFTMTHFRLGAMVLAIGVSGLMGCRGGTSRDTPIHLNPNMDTQDKFKSYRKSTFFKDGRTMRTPPAGTVARGKLRANDALYCGKLNTSDCASKDDGKFLESMPIPLTRAVMKRGRDRYNIYCAPCHDKTGYGEGKIAVRSNYAIKPPTLHSKRMGQMSVGEIFHTVSFGSKSQAMASYRHQITDVKDRWAVVAYVRALQRSQSARASRYVKPAPPPPPPPPVVPTEPTEEDGSKAGDGSDTGKTGGSAAPVKVQPAAPAAPSGKTPAAPAVDKAKK